jgi:Clostripain family
MAKPKWAVLVYAGAEDRELQQGVIETLKDLRSVDALEHVTIGAQVDWGHRGERITILPAGRTEPLTDFHSDAERTFRAFLDWGRSNFDAERRLLLLMGHGLGVGFDLVWPDPGARSIQAVPLRLASDFLFHGRRGLGVSQFARALSEGWHDELPSVVAFNSCFMSTAEVAYEMRTSAAFVVASQGLTPIGAFDCVELMSTLNGYPEISGLELGRLLLRGFLKKHAGDPENVMTLLDLTHVEPLASAMRGLVQALTEVRDDRTEWRVFRDALRSSSSFMLRQFPDLIDFASQLRGRSSNAKVLAATTKLQRLLRKGTGLIAEHEGVGAPVAALNGLSIFCEALRELDTDDRVRVKRDAYQQLGFSQATGWDALMYSIRPFRAPDKLTKEDTVTAKKKTKPSKPPKKKK